MEEMTTGKATDPVNTVRASFGDTRWLDGGNASFALKNGLLYMTLDGKETRVLLSRAFPFELLWEYISVQNEKKEELGMIRELSVFDESSAALLREELRRRYYVLRIQRILSVKERYGFSHWEVMTDEGEVKFTVHDTYRSLIRVGEDRAFLIDVDGNRFEIPSIEALDRKSLRKIELYL